MLILGKAIEWVAGKWMLPALVIGVLVLGGKVLDARRAALVSQGEAKCNNEWELALVRQQLEVTRANARAVEAQIEATDRLNEEIKANAARIKAELETELDSRAREIALARGAAVVADQRCISDGVRDMARGVSRDGGGKQGVGGGKGPAK
jgi:hypothetical protein